MKKTIILLAYILLASILNAGSGSATAPYWQKLETFQLTTISLTNISSENVTVFIMLKDIDGIAYDESSENGTNIEIGSNFSGDPLSNNGALLEAGKTGTLTIKDTGNLKTGYSTIEWVSNGSNIRALVGVTTHVVKGDASHDFNHMLINNGLPF